MQATRVPSRQTGQTMSCTGAQLFWNRKGSFLNGYQMVGSVQLSKMSLYSQYPSLKLSELRRMSSHFWSNSTELVSSTSSDLTWYQTLAELRLGHGETEQGAAVLM